MTTLRTPYTKPMAVQHGMDRGSQSLVPLKGAQGLPHEGLQLRLDLQPNASLDLIEILLHPS